MSHGANFLVHNIFVTARAGYDSFRVPFFYLILPNKLMKWPSEVFMVNIIWVSYLAYVSFRILKIYHYPPSFFLSQSSRKRKHH